ncbi:MAG: penicillin-binding protein 2, partial [Proteobacteria bacterium]|nr:penicillin-binding protein 2 [Pseudomonadota bacterium]
IFGGHKIRDLHNREPVLSVSDILIKSSNIGTARMAHATGAEAQKDFLDALGLLAPSEIELKEAAGARPLSPNRWGEIQTMSVSYGHGIAVSPLHLASAYATLANGGFRVVPTLIRADINADNPDRVRILSEETSQDMRKMLRRVVVDGTATLGNVAGYDVAGKTGTADKVNPKGGYYKERVIANFASVFPAADPRYVLVVVLDEPKITTLGEEQRTAGWTAVPVAAELISRMAPILGLAPISAQDNLLSVSAEPLAQE